MATLREQFLPPWRSSPETIGSLFGNRYRIVHKVADGAAGAVFCADDIGSREQVVIKLLRPELSEETSVVDRLRAGIRRDTELRRSDPGALAAFVRVVDIGKTAAGLVYLVMPYVVGDDLQSMLRRSGPLPWSRAQGLFTRMCSAFDDYHRRGRVHGSVQSKKCILGHDGKVMFFDDGVDAFLLGMATPEMARYLSPEQASAEEVGAAADIYSLAVVFYELLTARVPFEDSSPRRTQAMHMLSPVPPLHEVAPSADLPAGVEAAILRALAKDPRDRWASMAEFAGGLGGLGADSAETRAPLRRAGRSPVLSAVRQSPSLSFVPGAGLPAAGAPNEPTLIGLVLPSLLGSSESSENPATPTVREVQTPEVSDSAADASSEAGMPVSGLAMVATSEAQTPAMAIPNNLVSDGVPNEVVGDGVSIADLSGGATGERQPVVAGEEQSQAAGSVRRSAGGCHASASGRRIIDLLPGESSMRGRIEDTLHPSASSSMRSSSNASGSRRIVNLVDVRAPGESTTEGWTPAAESSTQVRVAGVASTRSRDVAVHGGVAAEGSNESLFDSTEDLASGRSEGGSTIRAAMLDDETLEAASFRPGPSRAAISWALGGVGALLAGSVALALMPSAEPPKAPEHEAAIIAPAFAPVPPEPVAPVAVAPELGSAVAPLSSISPSAETSLEGPDASTVARSSKGSKSSKSATKSKRSKRLKRTREMKKPRRAQTSKAAAASPVEEVEDDVLSQVQRYMREKKAREQRAHEAKRSEAERREKEAREGPSSADLATASERLSLARKAYKSGRFSAAYSLASQSLVAHRSVDALELMVLASCARGDGDRARQLVGKISGTRRATVQARCREHGISL